MQRIPTNTKRGAELIYPELSYEIMGLCFNVHNEFGRFSREKQYGDGLEKMFIERGLNYKREVRIGESGNIIDFIINDKIALELKAKPFLIKADYDQVQKYLQSSGLKLGLLVNFRGKHVQSRRIIRLDNFIHKTAFAGIR